MASVYNTKYTPGNQAAAIRQAFVSQSLEGLALASGMDGISAGNLGRAVGRGLGFGVQSPVTVPQANQSTTSTNWLNNITDIVGGFVQSRWGQQRGTITQLPDGTIVQKQAAGVPIQTQAPIQIVGSAGLQAPMGAATGFAVGSGTVLLIGAGIVMVMMLSGRRR